MPTPTALQRLARRALLARAKADATLIALVPAASIEPVGLAEWPFILIESPRSSSLRLACVRGAIASFDVHVFAGPKKSGETVTMTGYDHACQIAAELERVFTENWLTLENGAKCRIGLSDRQMLRDEKPDDWHWFAQMNCRVLSDVS